MTWWLRLVLAVAAMVLVTKESVTHALVTSQQGTFRLAVDAVFVPAWVKNGNRPVRGLTARDFELTDNGVPQQVTTVEVDALAVDITLVLDASGSISGPALEQFKTDIQMITDSLRPNDRVRLVTFGSTVTDVFGLQPGGTAVPTSKVTPTGATSFYNALAGVLVGFAESDRPHLIFTFTDGLDNLSFVDADQVVTLAGYSSASLYVALVRSAPGRPRSTPFQGGPNTRALREAVARTGGELFQVEAGTALPERFQQVLDDFRTSYLLTYTPTGVRRPGWHALQVRVAGKTYSVRARSGYQGG